jgi:hypothetical protein
LKKEAGANFEERLIAAVMKRWNCGRFGGVIGLEWSAMAVLALTIMTSGCSMLGRKPASAPAALPASDQTADSAPPPGPEAKIQISYSQPNDFLDTLSLTKYSGANALATGPGGSSGSATVVRFEGGMPVWQIDVEPGMFSEMPLGFSSKNYAVSEVKYGNVPPHFVQSIPDIGPPEPLEPGHFYIFSVTRKSGSISYDAVKVNGDGSLQAYEADPRAGTSFRLCCNLPADFTAAPPPSFVDSLPPPPSAVDPPLSPPDAPGP